MDVLECKLRHIQRMHSVRKMEKLCRYKQRKDRQYSAGCCRSNYCPWVSGETEGRLPRLLFSLPSGMDFRYSVSPRWAMPAPAIGPCFAMVTTAGLGTKEPSVVDNLDNIYPRNYNTLSFDEVRNCK